MKILVIAQKATKDTKKIQHLKSASSILVKIKSLRNKNRIFLNKRLLQFVENKLVLHWKSQLNSNKTYNL